MSIREGQLAVWTTNPDYGLAKVHQVNGPVSRISYFVSMAKQRVFEVPTKELRGQDPWPQNRVYVNQGDTWTMGRLTELRDTIDVYIVQFPNGVEKIIPESDVFVRSSGAVEPMEVLKLHGHETPFFFERRWPLVKHLLAQRAASAGIPALLSSAIDLRDHQVEVVRQVLHDPVPRYLLADEVGLGKTIEAGIIIRQLLIDEPGATVAVLVPPHLVDQWTDELDRRFRLRDFPQATVHVLVHGTPDIPVSNLLVIDEAHHVAGEAFGPPAEQHRYRVLAAAATHTPRVLLLSATPASSNHRAYLGMLHLLDPKVYALKDEAAFHARVQAQEALGNAAFALQPDMPVTMLETVFDDLLRLFPADQRVAEMIQDLRGGCANAPSMVSSLRAYISETYRLHRRMLRHRRETHAEHLVRGRTLGPSLSLPLTATAAAWDAFDAWREVLDLETDLGDRSAAVQALTQVWSAAVIGVPEWIQAVRQRLAVQGLSSGERDALSVMAERLERVDAPAVEQEVARAVAQAARQANGKTVVFLSGPAAAARLLTELERVLGPRRAALAAQGPATVKWFREHQDALVLVVDEAGEEGLNLQCADLVVHVDLPLDARRLEQRLGRLDRYGRGSKIVSRTVLSEAWPDVIRHHADLLGGPLDIHNTSVASVQVLLDSLLDEFGLATLEGAASQRRLMTDLPARLEAELDRVRQTEMLDAMQLDGSQVLEAQMEALHETEAQGFDRSFTRWVKSALQFKTVYDDHSVQFAFDKKRTLVNWERIKVLHPLLQRPSTFSRRDAQRYGLALLRAGEPFVDAMTAYINWDDRGRSYAYWRHEPGWAGDDVITFAMHFTVSGNLQALTRLAPREHLDEASLGRRMDGLLGPTTWTIYLDQDGRPVSPEAKAALDRPYDDGHGDYNLSAERVWVLDQLAPRGVWRAMCDHVFATADAQLRADPVFTKLLQDAHRYAQTMIDERLGILRSRQAAGQLDSDTRDLKVEELVAQALLEGIATPAVTLDAVGTVVLSARNPF
ncbi:protein DpdE [Deinococcus sp. MIMF12]|uniref:Protein DpdE n=1 Tax=Deinococcus rhizophilus TaxID=3049544 RepID=A0ABT7JHJ1_9DEIO|nr:protein DpdE [Deinococcus rhizophilus]MDL2343418.1 protein DpdE [Deinococcus rhizophilus]